MLVAAALIGGVLVGRRYAAHSPANHHKRTPTLTPTSTPTMTHVPASHAIKTVFIILMENANFSDIKGSPSAPYINGLLTRPDASYATQYFTTVHPSEPNYVWLEAGSNANLSNANASGAVSFSSDDDPSLTNSTSTTDHLVAYLQNAGISWKAYEEDISGSVCPLSSSGLYAAKHNPMVFFQDVTGNNNPGSSYCVAHERPYSQLATDLANNTVAHYNFITPNLCGDMHDSGGCATQDRIKNGDTWLSNQVPTILTSSTYQNGGALFITWDEGTNGSDGPLGMIVLSPFAKGNGYHNSIHYTHSSTLRTVEEIFGVRPFLRGAQNATDLSDLFATFP